MRCAGKVPKSIGELTNLQTFSLQENPKLAELPAEIHKLTALKQLNVVGNNLRKPPQKIAEQGIKAVCEYFELIMRDGFSLESWTVKAVFVGQGSSGKTSLLRTATEHSSKLMPVDARTIGIEIETWRPEGNGIDKLEIKAWDFAGQSDYYATHQLFLNPQALFVLCLNVSRTAKLLAAEQEATIAVNECKDEEMLAGRKSQADSAARRLEQHFEDDVLHWLRVLNARCPASVVLPVATQIDGVSDLAASIKRFEAALRSDATGSLKIQSVVSTSSKTFTGIDDFIQAVTSSFRNQDLFPRVGEVWPPAWFRCRNFIEALRAGHDPRAAIEHDPKEPFMGAPLVNAPKKFLFREELHEIWERRSADVEGIEATSARKMLDKVLKLLEAEGEVLILEQQVHIRPSWLVNLLKPLVDHELGESTNRRRQQVLANNPEAGAALETFLREGTAPLWLLRELWVTELPDIAKDEFISASLTEMLENNGALFRLPRSGSNVVPFYVVPFQLPKKAPLDADREWGDLTQTDELRVNFSFVPPGFIERLIARLHHLGDLRLYWRRGALLVIELDQTCGVCDLGEPPTPWEGSAKLRFEVHDRDLVAAARGDEWLRSKCLVVVRYFMNELREQFPGLRLDEMGEEFRASTKAEIADVLKLAVAKEAAALPSALMDSLASDSPWWQSFEQVQKRFRDMPTLKLNEEQLSFSGRGLLVLDVQKPLRGGMAPHERLLKEAGLKPPKRTKLQLELENWGQPFFRLVAAQLAQGQRESELLRFEYVKQLGKGAYGKVYELKQRDTGSRVALKDQLSQSPTELIKLEKEASLQVKASGPHVVKCEGNFGVGAHFCMLTELCPGGELGKWLESNKDSPPDLWRVVDECIKGLVHIHAKLIMHRDLKLQVR